MKIPVDVINKYNLKLLVVFGSAGTQFEHPESDLDLGFLSKKALSIEEEQNLLQELMVFYRRGNIDLVNLVKADPVLKMEIARNGRLLYEEDDTFLNFQLYSSRIYADTRHLRSERELVLEERMKNYE